MKTIKFNKPYILNALETSASGTHHNRDWILSGVIETEDGFEIPFVFKKTDKGIELENIIDIVPTLEHLEDAKCYESLFIHINNLFVEERY